MKRIALLAAPICLALVTVALGQTTRPVATTRPGARSAEEMLGQMLRPAAPEARPLQPAPAPTAAVDLNAPVGAAPRNQPLIREGSLLLDRIARLVRNEDAKSWQLTFDADGRGMTDPPMIVLPNSRLAEMEAQARAGMREPRFRVSGEVTEYRGRNYILLQRFSLVSDVVNPLQ